MANTKIVVTGAEALEDLKRHFPNSWQNELQEGKRIIGSAIRLFNCEPLEAVTKYFNKSGNSKNLHAVTAAVYIMTKEHRLSTSIKQIDYVLEQIRQQLHALETQNTFSQEQKTVLRPHYYSERDKYNAQREQLINQFEVVGAQFVSGSGFAG